MVWKTSPRSGALSAVLRFHSVAGGVLAVPLLSVVAAGSSAVARSSGLQELDRQAVKSELEEALFANRLTG